MTNFLIKRFIKTNDSLPPGAVRGRYGLLSSLVGIICNAVLFFVKFIIGTLSGSVSIMADSINNLSDAASSVVTLVGFRVSGKPADEGHPFGHARAEYIGGLIVSFIILLLGLEFFRNSLSRVLHPQPLDVSLPAIIVLALSIGLKVWLSAFNRHIGREIGSTALLATAQDSLNDVVATSAVLAATVLSKWTGLVLDGWMGILVALFILYSGIQIAKDTVSPLLGAAPPEKLVAALREKVLAYPGVLGMHDLVIHSYGPQSWFASVHAEVDAKRDILKSHDLIDNIERDVQSDMQVNLVVHLDPIVLDDPKLNELHRLVKAGVAAIDPRLDLHDFRMVRGETHSNLIFDIALPTGFSLADNELVGRVQALLDKQEEKYFAVITVDRSYLPSRAAPLKSEE